MNLMRLAVPIGLVMLAAGCKNPYEEHAEQLAAKNEARSQEQSLAVEEVRQFLGQKMNMDEGSRKGLQVKVIDDWALASDANGIEFLCRREVSGWALVASGTEIQMPADAPYGLALE